MRDFLKVYNPITKKPFEENQIFFTSDTHAFHKKVLLPKGNTPHCSFRKFEDEFVMTEAIVEGINSIVKENDLLVHLGDWSFGGISNISYFRNLLKCKNILLALGNHDQHIANCRIDEENRIYLPNLFLRTFDIGYYNLGSHNFVFCHYPLVSWQHSNGGTICLSGHEHANLDISYYNNYSMDVGIDNYYKLFGEYKPFTYQEVIDITTKKPLNLIH